MSLQTLFPFLRWLNTTANANDESVESKPARPLNITYVNFDKTKPIQKQNNYDTPPTLNKKTSSKDVAKNKCNGQSSNAEFENNLPEKIRKKRQSKLVEPETKQPDVIPRVTKKHKKDG